MLRHKCLLFVREMCERHLQTASEQHQEGLIDYIDVLRQLGFVFTRVMEISSIVGFWISNMSGG